MKTVFLNHTNHPYEKWGVLQKEKASVFGTVVDFPFPQIPAEMSGEDVKLLAIENSRKIIELQPVAVLCQGEFCYTIAMTEILKAHHIIVLCACSERYSREKVLPNGSVIKTSEFVFVQFREC